MLAVDLAFKPDTHQYFLAGKPLPSVTQVIDFLNDYSFVKEDVMEEARARGEAVHLATALYDRDDLDEESVDPIVRPYLDAWIKFRSETGFVPDLIEQAVCSAVHGYAGTLDRTGRFNTGSTGLIDVKSTAMVMPTCGPQTAAYKKCLVDQCYPGASQLLRYTINLRADGTYRLNPHRDPNDLNVFLSALNLHQWKKQWT